MKANEKKVSKRYTKTLTLLSIEKTDRDYLYKFTDKDNNIWSHHQVSKEDAMKYGGLKAYQKAHNWLKLCPIDSAPGLKYKAAVVIREMDESAYSAMDHSPKVYRNAEELLKKI